MIQIENNSPNLSPTCEKIILLIQNIRLFCFQNVVTVRQLSNINASKSIIEEEPFDEPESRSTTKNNSHQMNFKTIIFFFLLTLIYQASPNHSSDENSMSFQQKFFNKRRCDTRLKGKLENDCKTTILTFASSFRVLSNNTCLQNCNDHFGNSIQFRFILMLHFPVLMHCALVNISRYILHPF